MTMTRASRSLATAAGGLVRVRRALNSWRFMDCSACMPARTSSRAGPCGRSSNTAESTPGGEEDPRGRGGEGSRAALERDVCGGGGGGGGGCGWGGVGVRVIMWLVGVEVQVMMWLVGVGLPDEVESACHGA